MGFLRPKSCQKNNVGVANMRKSRKAGFSLVEVMVSILVLAVGVIGAAGMQLTARRTSQQAIFHTHGLLLAAEMADAVRVSERRMAESVPYLGLDYRSEDGEPVLPYRLCYANECDAEEFAAFQIYEWKQRISTSLPAGRVLICRDSVPWSSTGKALSWDCDTGAAGNAPVVVKLGWRAKNTDGSPARTDGDEFPPIVAFVVSTVTE